MRLASAQHLDVSDEGVKDQDAKDEPLAGAPSLAAVVGGIDIFNPARRLSVLCIGQAGQALANVLSSVGADAPLLHIEQVQTFLEAQAVLDSSSWDVVLIRDDVRSKSALEQVARRTPRIPVVCLCRDVPGPQRPVRHHALRQVGFAACLFDEELTVAFVDAMLRQVVATWRLAARICDGLVRVVEPAASEDPLTRLATRASFLRKLGRALEAANEDAGKWFTVIFLDIKRFGQLNETLGAQTCDALLTAVGERITACVRPGDVVARYGGDQFTVLVESVAQGESDMQVADRLRWAMREPFELGSGAPVYIEVASGLTRSDHGYKRSEEVVFDAQRAAKRARAGSSPQIYRTQLRLETVESVKLEMDLRRAVERQEFTLHYQPIVSLADTRVRGFEALMRWDRPGHGLVSPADFIPIAERTGMIVPMGRWAIGQALRQLAAWRTELEIDQDIVVSVNMSAKQSEDEALVSFVRRALDSSGLPAKLLKIELTESSLVNSPVTMRHIEQLKALGVEVWVDDFGTGYSSLAQLQSFPVDGLKIDKSFVDRLDGSDDSGRMVASIIELAHNFGLHVVAEGIESRVQSKQLRRLGCPAGQGFLFSRPLSLGDAYGYLSNDFDDAVADGDD